MAGEHLMMGDVAYKCGRFSSNPAEACVPRTMLVEREAEVERLREALEPFVAAYEAIDFLHCPDFRGPLDLAFFDNARKVLRG